MHYTDEILKEFSRTNNEAGNVVGGPYAQEMRSDPLTWRLALNHQFISDVLRYVSYNKGFKSGGYNLTCPGSAPFFPEHVDAYETGVKSEFLDHRVRLSASAFCDHYTDLQVAVALGGNQLFENAAAARNFGLDESLDIAVTDHLTLSTGVGLLNAKYTDYPNARGYTPLGKGFPILNAKGAYLPFAPPVTGIVAANYLVPTSIGQFKGTTNWSDNDQSYATPDEGLERSAHSNAERVGRLQAGVDGLSGCPSLGSEPDQRRI